VASTEVVDERPPSRFRGRWWPAAAVALVTVVASVVFGLASLSVPGPDVFGDELFYMEAGTSLAQGDGLLFRGQPYRLAPAYPAVVVSLAAGVTGDGSDTYRLVLLLNALLFASSAIPVFLLGSRVLRPWTAAAVGGLVLLLPSSFYAGYVIADCLGYTVALWALLAIQLAVERPSPLRQTAVIAAAGIAISARYQYVVLVPTFILALALRVAAESATFSPTRAVRRLAPTIGLLGVAGGVLGVRELAQGGSVLGAYGVLWRSYEVLAILEWTSYHVLALALYVLVAPVLLLPGIVMALRRDALAGDRCSSAFLAVFGAATVFAVGLVGVFSSTSLGLGRLHDRYLIYVVPLWLIALAAWHARGGPVLRRPAVAIALFLASIAIAAPLDQLIRWVGEIFDAVGTAPWALARHITKASGTSLTVLVVVSIVTIAALTIVASRARTVLVAVGCGVVVVMAWGMWERAIAVGGVGAFSGTGKAERLWVDKVAGREVVVSLFHLGPRCNANDTRGAFWVSEFFNRSIREVYSFGALLDREEPRSVTSASDGILQYDGAPLEAPLVVAPRSLVLDGRRVAQGTRRGLTLWRTEGPIRVRATRPCA
jgi:hypothetical protein